MDRGHIGLLLSALVGSTVIFFVVVGQQETAQVEVVRNEYPARIVRGEKMLTEHLDVLVNERSENVELCFASMKITTVPGQQASTPMLLDDSQSDQSLLLALAKHHPSLSEILTLTEILGVRPEIHRTSLSVNSEEMDLVVIDLTRILLAISGGSIESLTAYHGFLVDNTGLITGYAVGSADFFVQQAAIAEVVLSSANNGTVVYGRKDTAGFGEDRRDLRNRPRNGRIIFPNPAKDDVLSVSIEISGMLVPIQHEGYLRFVKVSTDGDTSCLVANYFPKS